MRGRHQARSVALTKLIGRTLFILLVTHLHLSPFCCQRVQVGHHPLAAGEERLLEVGAANLREEAHLRFKAKQERVIKLQWRMQGGTIMQWPGESTQ